MLGVTRDGPGHMRIADPFERAGSHRLADRALGDERQRLRVAERLDGRQAVGFGDAFERLERDVAEHRHRLLADRGLGVCRKHGERRRIHQLADGRATDADVRVVPRDLGQQLAFGNGDFLDEAEPDRRVGMLLPGLCAKSIQQCHVRR